MKNFFAPHIKSFINFVEGGDYPMAADECYNYLESEDLYQVMSDYETQTGIRLSEEDALECYHSALSYFEDLAIEDNYL